MGASMFTMEVKKSTGSGCDILIIRHTMYICLLFTLSSLFKILEPTNNAVLCAASNSHHHNHEHSRQSRSSYYTQMLSREEAHRSDHQDQQQHRRQVLDQCTACDEAKYELVFEGLWSSYTHPDDFPGNYWLAYFSDIIGASHSNEFTMWAEDSLASEGVKELAETGSTKKLEFELKQESSKTRTIIKARELRYPNLNSRASAVFRTDKQHHLVSILSKLGPSPDWMVGVSGLELCQQDGSWSNQKVVNMYLWDAGTDSGTSFTSDDQPSRPPERIHPFRRQQAANNGSAGMLFNVDTNSYDISAQRPLEAAAPTRNQDQQTKPFARLTITRQRVYEKPCNAPAYQPGQEPSSSLSWTTIEPTRPSVLADCRSSDWSDWSTCSSTCGHGIRTRTRTYIDPRALSMGCSHKELIDKEICLSECSPNGTTCFTTDWSEWTRCSVDCGHGYRQRTRSLIGGTKNRKSCDSTQLLQREPCHNDCPTDADASHGTNLCELTDWSEWSTCSAFCGKGFKTRSRQYKKKDRIEACNAKLVEKKSCTGNRPDLCPKQNPKDIINTCTKPKDPGPCKGRYERWHYDNSLGTCSKFTYGGCLGNSNNFRTIRDCRRGCAIPLKGSASKTTPINPCK